MRLKKILFILTFLSFSLLNVVAQETIVDTVYSIAELDGAILYKPYYDQYGLMEGIPYMVAGDAWQWIDMTNAIYKSFMTFELPNTPYGYFLETANLNLYQGGCKGNNIEYIYPIFDYPDSTVIPNCLIEPIIYGEQLSISAFDVAALGSPKIISNSPDIGWRSKDITDYVINDMESDRVFTQYRIRLSLDTDDDSLDDVIYFLTSENIDFPPFVEYTFSSQNSSEEHETTKASFKVFPNPISDIVTISFDSKSTNQYTIEMFNIKGQIIKRIYECNSVRGINEHIVNMGDISNGIYLIKFKNDSTITSKKVVILK